MQRRPPLNLDGKMNHVSNLSLMGQITFEKSCLTSIYWFSRSNKFLFFFLMVIKHMSMAKEVYSCRTAVFKVQSQKLLKIHVLHYSILMLNLYIWCYRSFFFLDKYLTWTCNLMVAICNLEPRWTVLWALMLKELLARKFFVPCFGGIFFSLLRESVKN